MITDKCDWVVRVYDYNDELITKWVLHDRTEQEAFKEAESDVMRIPGEADWSLMKKTTEDYPD